MLSEDFEWVYPPAGVPANTIGPVHLYDTIAMSWTPSQLVIEPPYKIQMACQFSNKSYVFLPVSNIKSPYLWFFNETYDPQPYQCWYGFETPPNGTGGTGAAFHVVPTTAATAITFSATATPTSSPAPSVAAATTALVSTTAPVSTTASAAGVSNTTATTSDSGLSTGAKAGIGIGVAGSVVLLIALALWLLFVRKRNANKKSPAAPDALYDAPEMGTKSRGPYDKPPLNYVEAEAPYPYVEAEAREPRVEMPA